jgi:hypothetical protein
MMVNYYGKVIIHNTSMERRSNGQAISIQEGDNNESDIKQTGGDFNYSNVAQMERF